TMPPSTSRFGGDVYIGQTRDLAISFARHACLEQQHGRYTYFNIFCDCSTSKTSDDGSIPVTYQPWIPAERAREPVVGATRPVKPLFSSDVGELLAVSEALVIATYDIAKSGPRARENTVVVRIFNDNMFNLQYLQGSRALDQGRV
ncbi:hypothetical protein C8A00DRAFT_15044, partial [Chaetomidium leptoderma]